MDTLALGLVLVGISIVFLPILRGIDKNLDSISSDLGRIVDALEESKKEG